MNQIYFESKGEALLDRIGMSKSEFARRMGIRKQNVKVLFKSKNLETIYKASEVIGVPFAMLIGYTEESDLNAFPILPPEEEYTIAEDDIPTGNTIEERRNRQQIILDFYQAWKERTPGQKKYNLALQDDINIRSVSVVETAAQASLTYLSTLAVLQLDAILTNARFIRKVPSKAHSKNQRPFESMILMEHLCPGVGKIKMTVGVRRSDKMKIQYCITAIDTLKTKQEAV